MELPPPPGTRRVSINPYEPPRKFSTFSGMMPTRSSLASAGTSKLSTLGSLRAPALIPSPILQKSTLSPPDAMLRRGSNVSSVHYADEQGKPLPSDTDKEKDKEKAKAKGTGTRLLNMLKKTLKGSDSEEMITAQETPNLIPFGDVVGCLAVHIKTCRHFSHRFIIQQHVNMFLRVSINHIVKCTKLRNLKAVNNEKNLVLRFDEVKYFSVQVPRRQDDERNNIFLELMQDGGNTEKRPLSLGSAESHLYEVIQKGCFTEVLQMMHRHSFICRLEVEFMFSYGNFGYGFSHQLKPLQKIIEPSMFMKIAPPPDRTDPVTNVITPQRVEYPAFLSPELNVTIGAAEASQPSAAVRLEKLHEKPRERLEKMKKEYRNLNTWMEKAEYLKNIITPKVTYKDSEEVSLIEMSEQNYSLIEEPDSMSHDIHYRKSDTFSNESMDRENLVIPALKVLDQDLSEPFLHESGESTPGDMPLPPIHSLQIIEEDEVQRPYATPVWEDKPQDERGVVLPVDEQLIPKRPSILRIASSLQEVRHKKEKFPHFSDVLTISDKPLGQENTNQKGKPFIQLRKSWETRPTDLVSSLRKVAFAQQEYTTPVFREESAEFKPKHQKFIKGGLDPFLRNINSKMSFKKKKDQDTYRYPSTLSTEVAEHEDQDPPYPDHSRSAGSNTTWANNPNLITIHMVNKKNNVPPDHTTTTIMTSDRKNKLPHDTTLNTTNTSPTKNIFASDNPVITITKMSESDYKLSTDPSSNTTKASETRLLSDSSSNTWKPSETRQSSSHSSNTTKPSEMRLSSGPSSNTMNPSEMRLSSSPSSNTTKPSEMRLSSGPSSNTMKPSEMRLSSSPSSNTTKPSEMRLSSGHSSNTMKPSEMRLSSSPSSNTTKPSEMRLSSSPSSNTTKPSEMRLSSSPSSNTTKPSEMRLSSGHSSNSTKPSEMRLSSGHSSNTTKPSEMRLSSGPGSNITKPSETRLSSGPGSNTTKPSETRLSSGHSSNTTKPSEMRLSSGHSSNTMKPSEMRLSSGHSSNTMKPSETRLSSGHSSNTMKPSETRLSSGPGSNTTKPSETRLSSGPGSNTTYHSESRLSSGPGSNTTKPSETRLSSGPGSNTTNHSESRLSSGPGSNITKPSETRLSSGPGSNTTNHSESRLSSGPGSNTTKPSEMRLSSGHSSNTTKPSEMRLSSGPGSNTTNPSESRLSSSPGSNTMKPSEMRLSSGPSSNTTKSSGTNRLSHNPIIDGNKSSDTSKLSHDPSNISTKSSDPSKLSHDSSISARKSSDPNKLSHDASITSTKSLDSKNKLPSGKPTVNSDLTTNTAKTPDTRDKLAWDPDTVTVDSSDMQSELEEQLPDVSSPNYRRESSMTRNVSICHPSSSINFTSDIENLKQSIVLKSILSKNLQDLSDELFSKPEVCTNAEEMEEGSPLPLSVRDRRGTEDRVFEQVQDINSWLSPKDILNSQTLLSSVIKSVPQDLLPEGGPGTSSDIGTSSNIEDGSDKHFKAAEIHFPMNRKSSFKTKHLVSEVLGSDQGLNAGVCDYVIKQIFTAPIFSNVETGATALGEVQTALQDQLLTCWERRPSSQILTYEEKGNEAPLSPPKAAISKIIQSFPVETLLDSGIIKVIQLDKENQSSLLDIQTASPEEKLQKQTEQHHNVENQTKLLSRQSIPSTKLIETFVNAADYTEDSQSTSAQESNYPKAERKSNSPNEHQSLDTEEAGLSSAVESLSSLMGSHKDADTVMLKSVLKSIFKNFLKYNQSERREQLGREFDRLTQRSSPRGTEHLEKMQENFNKAGKADKKPILDPKLCVFLEKLSESEVKNMKSELSKHIQHYLLEKLSEAGHITKEDLPQIYRNLYLMNEKTELKEQSSFQDKYSKTVEEIMSFVNNFNHHFIDKHLEIKLRSFLNEILQNYFLKNLSGSNLLSETDGVALSPSVSSMASNSTSKSLHGLGQDMASGSFGSRLKINMKYPFNESLQNYLKPLSENELLNLKADLSKCVQVLFLDKLSKSGLMTERQLQGISQQVSSLTSPSTPFKCIKTDLRDESCSMREDSEEQKKYPKIGQNTTFQTFLEDIREETELTRKGEKRSSFSHNLKENPPTIWEHKHVYSREVKTLNLMKVQPPPNRTIKAIPLNKSPERPTDILLKKHKQDHGFMQLPQAENSIYKTETQEPYGWDGRSKPIQSKLCFEKTLKVKALEKRENSNVSKLTVQERPDTCFSPYLKLPTCKTSRENEHLNRLSFPAWRTNTFIYVNTENGEQSKLDQYCQRWKENNNNNKKHLVTFAQFKNEMETLYINPYEDCNEKSTKSSESQSFRYKDEERNSRPSFFPEVLTRENMKSKRKERDYTTKPKKSFHKIVRILPAALPTARPHLRKSVPRTLLHWTARRTIHDCLDRFDDLQIPSVKRPKNSKSRARLLGKSLDDSYNQAKHCARPSTAPESNKRRESVTGKFASPRMVSAGLVHIHDPTPEYDIRKLRSKRKLKENIEKRPLIYDIIQMLDTAE